MIVDPYVTRFPGNAHKCFPADLHNTAWTFWKNACLAGAVTGVVGKESLIGPAVLDTPAMRRRIGPPPPQLAVPMSRASAAVAAGRNPAFPNSIAPAGTVADPSPLSVASDDGDSPPSSPARHRHVRAYATTTTTRTTYYVPLSALPPLPVPSEAAASASTRASGTSKGKGVAM